MLAYFTKNTRRGFTLIELLVVIAIIGILSSVVLASLNSARQKGRDSRRVADIKQLQLALELWYDACGSYPADANFIAGTGTGCGAGVGLVSNGYISVLPTDPSTNVAYFYDQEGSGTGYHLGANLEDPNHNALDTDVDADTTDVDGADATACDGVATNVRCFDVRP